MLSIFENRRSWVTQRLANRFPPYTRAHLLGQSTAQQMLEPIGQGVEDRYWWQRYNQGNALLATSDINQISGIRRLTLPPTLQWRTRHDPDSIVYFDPTLVTGSLNGSWITLSQAENNSLEEFWYGVPTRISIAGESKPHIQVLSPTLVSLLGSASLTAPKIPGRLWVVLTGNDKFLRNYKGTLTRAVVELRGIDIYGKEAKERIPFAFNGALLTKVFWADVDTVLTEYIDENAYIQIDWLSVSQSEVMDPAALHIDSQRESIRFYSLGERDYGSTLKHLVHAGLTLLDVQVNGDVKNKVREIELLDSSEENVSLSSFALWPRRRWIVGTDGSNVHFFVPDLSIPDLSVLNERTSEVVLQIEALYEWMTKGDTVRLGSNLTRPHIQVHRTRWSVKKPDGTRVGLSPGGVEIAYSESAWVPNTTGAKINQTGFQGYQTDYTMDQTGQYTFYLESTISDVLRETATAVIQTDVRVIMCANDVAQASVELPVSVSNVSLIGFDSYHRPWVVDENGTAHRINFHHDVYLIDFDNKYMYFREDYDEIEVTI